jgi:hypothetical protein
MGACHSLCNLTPNISLKRTRFSAIRLGKPADSLRVEYTPTVPTLISLFAWIR